VNGTARLSLLLLALAGSGALYLYARTPRGAAALEGAIVSAKKVGDAVATALQPRGIRNHNPGNIRYDGTSWQGLADPLHDAGGYLRFVDPLWGLRALARDLTTKHAKGLRTIAAIIGKYAPPNENDTRAYIRAVAQRLFPELKGEGAEAIDEAARTRAVNVPARITDFMRAVVAHENGARWEHHFTQAQYEEGARRAGA
jgi:hypothetical protein